MKHYNEYKYVLINDNINETVDHLTSIIKYNILIDKLKLQTFKILKTVK